MKALTITYSELNANGVKYNAFFFNKYIDLTSTDEKYLTRILRKAFGVN